MFTHSKVAQIAAYFAQREGGPISILKLMKLMYLADRASMEGSGLPISFDLLVSMDHGPVLSRTLNLINGTVGGEGGAAWDEWISDRENHTVSITHEFDRSDLKELSRADLEVLDAVWAELGHMDQWALRDYTHQHCGEWIDPEHSSVPIADKEVYLALGVDDAEATRLADTIADERRLDYLLSRC